jgi:hypothetical protein
MHPDAGRSMPQSTFCPYCNAKLRISASRRTNKVKCRSCSSVFHPNQVNIGDKATVSLETPLIGSSSGTSAPAQPSTREPASVTIDASAGAPEESPAETTTESSPESINPLVAEAAFPADIAARRAARRDAVRSRVKKMRQTSHNQDLRKYEMIFALSILAIGVAGAAYLGWYLLKPTSNSSRLPSPPTENRLENSSREKQLLEADFSEKPLPKRLIGVWERRSDDETHGWVEYREDSGVIARAWTAGDEVPSTTDHWYLVRESGDELVIDIGPERGSLNNTRYCLLLSGNDAYTLTEIQKKGNRKFECVRFVRKRGPLS